MVKLRARAIAIRGTDDIYRGMSRFDRTGDRMTRVSGLIIPFENSIEGVSWRPEQAFLYGNKAVFANYFSGNFDELRDKLKGFKTMRNHPRNNDCYWIPIQEADISQGRMEVVQRILGSPDHYMPLDTLEEVILTDENRKKYQSIFREFPRGVKHLVGETETCFMQDYDPRLQRRRFEVSIPRRKRKIHPASGGVPDWNNSKGHR